MGAFFILQSENKSATVGGVKLLLDFSRESISVKVKNGEVRVLGQGLVIERFDEDEMKIVGKIENIETNMNRGAGAK
ncbi:MAG: YabP/YqfC family sporulation protein [Christensenellaceae bacterium]|jgi:ferric-dicitrate binding protein FerR (iron transport regulator)|nr:YabP/YqfC family sporulation protein [Christensenellaceae bacterium]